MVEDSETYVKYYHSENWTKSLTFWECHLKCISFNENYPKHTQHIHCPYTMLIHSPCMFDPLYIHVSHAPCSIPYTYMYPMLHVRSLIHTCIPCSMFDPLYIHVSHAPCSIPYTYMYPMLHVRSLIHTCIPCSMFDPLYIHVSHAPCSIPYTYMYPMLHVRSLIHTCIPCSMLDPLT